MTDDKAEILKKVRKLLARSKDTSGSTEGERDQALRMAHGLLARHNLDIAELESKGQVDNDRGILKTTFYGRPWARSVAGAVASMLFCDYVYISVSKTKDAVHLFIGREANTITASELSSYLVESINREATAYKRRVGGANDTYRSFAWGATAAITKRCQELREVAEGNSPAEPTGKGLVLYRANEDTANQELRSKVFPELGKGRSAKDIHDRYAVQSGRQYGETVSLNRQVEGPQATSHLRLTKE